MIFLFEEFAYSTDYLKEVIGYRGNSDFQSESGFNTKAVDTGAKINGVGYCFFNGNPVFVLPKVFRKRFREDFLELLDKYYVFYAVWPKNSETEFVNAHFRMLAGKIFKPADLKCLILALEKTSIDDDDVKEMWKRIEGGCEMIARVTPKEIWENDLSDLEEAEFEEKSVVFDESLNGFFVKRESFEKAKIGEVHRLPKYIMNKPVVGNVFLQNGFSAGNPKFSDKDEYYFLPCKEG